ncbi:MAG: SRPBCC domain-containing protein [Bacteroidetes bacterium]|nr:SRPBCC domain-containing protein [Bacteroidota bacterium]
MKNNNFTTTILVDQTPKEAFDAINNVRGWWFGDIEGRTEKLNDEFTYRFKEFHYSKQRLVEFVPDKKVVWLVTDSSLNFVDDKDEWTGTKISFEVSPKGDKTEVRFTHEGLVPGQECYDACSNAWGDYIQKSLRSLISTGKGEAIF